MNSYSAVILEAVLFFPFVAFVFTLPYVVYNYFKYGSVLSIRIGIIYSFILYLMCVYFLVILPLPSFEEAASLTIPRAQITPWKFISDIIRQSHIIFTQPSTYTGIFNKAFFQFVFNIIMTIPFGIYLHYYFKCRLLKTVCLSLLLSLFFELTQLTGLYFIYPRNYRLFDVDDLLANTLGGLTGYAAVTPFLRFLPSREQIDQASFHRGRQVSFTRRFVSFMFDLIPIMVLIALIGFAEHITNKSIPYPFCIGAFIYYSLIPIIFRGRTFGKFITKTKIISVRNRRASWYQYILRTGSFLMVMYVLPVFLHQLFIPWLKSMKAPVSGIIVLNFIIFCIYFFYIFFAAIMAALHRRLFYEKLSGTKIISTIRTPYDNKILNK